jgi:hypothetical protein
MIEENFPAWPVRLRARLAADLDPCDPAAIDLASAISITLAGFLDGCGTQREARAALATEALAIVLVQAADHLDRAAPAAARLEWLLTRIGQRAWALQLAARIPAPRPDPVARTSSPPAARAESAPAEPQLPCDVEPQP